MKDKISASGTTSHQIHFDTGSAHRNAKDHNSIKRNLVKFASHDIQGSFFSVAGVAAMAKLACQKGEDPILFLEHLMDACQAFKQKLSNFVEYSRCEAGLRDTRLESVDVKRLLRNVYDNSKAYAAEEDVRIQLHLAESFPDEVQADEGRIGVVFANLLHIAITSSSKGSSILVHLEKDTETTWFVSMEAAGNKLTTVMWDELFNAGELADTALANDIRMAIIVSRHIVEDVLNGHLHFYREADCTKFEAVLPLNMTQ
jgi:signal transduction histidine kinase